MPASRTGRLRCLQRRRGWRRARLRSRSGSMPRKASLAPSSTMTASTSSVSDPVEPVARRPRRIARDPGIDDPDIVAPGFERRFELGREGLAGIDARSPPSDCRQRREYVTCLAPKAGDAARSKSRSKTIVTADQHARIRQRTALTTSKSWLDKPRSPPHLPSPCPSRLISLENVHLTLPSRAGPVEILRGVDLSVNAGRGARHRRAVGIGQDHLADGDRRARTGQFRQHHGHRHRISTARARMRSPPSGATRSASCSSPSI